MAEKKQPDKNNNFSPIHSSDEYDDDDDDNAADCGVGGFKPAALRSCANINVFTGVYSFCALLSSTLTSYVNSQVTTLERHFGFNSAQTGLIMAANDVGFLVLVLFVSYIAARVHIPHALSLVTVLFGVSGIICALPQFMFGAPSPSGGSDVTSSNDSDTAAASKSQFLGQLCDGLNDSLSDCGAAMSNGMSTSGGGSEGVGSARSNTQAALAIIVLGMMLQGFAKAPRSSFCTTYVDANVKRKTQTGFYMGIVTTVAIMGPAVAFALGGLFTRIYVTLEETDMHFRHPKWIGAWWLGYITFGVAAVVFGIPIYFFPRRIKGGKTTLKEAQAKLANKVSICKQIAIDAKGFVSAMWRLVTNPIYVLTVLSSCFLLFSVAGTQSFTPKYIENIFGFPVWKANMAMAGMMLGTACVGTFVGGYLTKKFKMGPWDSLKFICVSQLIATTASALQLAFKCDQPYLYNSPGPRANEETSLSGCLGNCACDDNEYFPICGADGRSFFSPCHAGCLSTIGQTGYSNCTCIAGGTATAGMCDYSCDMFIPFMVSMCLSAFAGTCSIIPKLIIYIRAVGERDKPLALGFASFMTSVTGWMLGPIIFGKLIDGICIQWESGCAGQGSCKLYDNEVFRLKLYGYQSAFRGLGLLCMLIAFLVAKCTNVFDQPRQNKDTEMALVNDEKPAPLGNNVVTSNGRSDVTDGDLPTYDESIRGDVEAKIDIGDKEKIIGTK